MALKRPERPASIEIPDDALLSQYGRVVPGQPVFRSRPRWDHESDLSLILGKLAVEEVTALVTGRIANHSDRVRYVKAGDLRKRGFLVGSTPTRRIPLHVSVTVPAGAVPWDHRTEAQFEACCRDQGGAE